MSIVDRLREKGVIHKVLEQERQFASDSCVKSALSDVRDERDGYDRGAISDLQKKAVYYEEAWRRKINSFDETQTNQVAYDIRASVSPDGHYARHDTKLWIVENRTKERALSDIELECGMGKNNRNWTSRLPGWWNGLNHLTRKDYTLFPFFTKFSLTLESGWCTYCPWLIWAINNGFVKMEDGSAKSIGLDGRTNEDVWKVRHDVWHRFEFDVSKEGVVTKDGFLVVVEDDEWWKWWYFVLHRLAHPVVEFADGPISEKRKRPPPQTIRLVDYDGEREDLISIEG